MNIRSRWKKWKHRSRRIGPGGPDRFAGPIRGELLGAERLGERARTLASEQVLATGARRTRKAPLLARLDQTESILEDIYDRLSERTDAQGDLGSAGEWLLDNYYVVQEHIREIRQTLPKGYYRELPELAEGQLAGYPRIYELATTLISHTEGRIDLDNIGLFVEAFQSTATLKLGELWAIPAVLRLGLIENVRRMALRTVRRLDDITEADRRINRIRAAENKGQLMAELGRLSGDSFALTSAFSSRLLHQLNREQDESPLRRAMEQWARDNGLSTDEADARARQHLALTQVITANNILSLRGLARMDWKTFVESQSAMEAVLRSDPSGIYPGMTFGTRDQYRHAVEQIARKTGKSEVHVARLAIELCGGDEEHEAGARRSHVGFYLIDDGRPDLYVATGYRQPLAARALQHPETVFFGGIVLVTVAVLAAILWLIQPPSLAWALFACALALIPATEVAVSVVNQLVALLVTPAKLPRLDFESTGGIPDAFRTAVVVPTLLDSVDSVVGALDNLEVQYLANRGPNLHYALLSDFVDATAETEDADDAILTAAIEGVRELNNRYSAGAKDVFFLFHRSRQWNAQEGVWMGWERKRGKLAQFNRFLRGETGAFSTIVGDPTVLQSVRYVITLDADTVLPPVAVPMLVGTLAHPLNQAVYDADSGRVVRGFGILQPRVGVSLPSAHRSQFAAIHARDPGVDPYSTATSDVYQDLFGEGSFTGKGIYDVDVFEQATKGRFPENTLLSHDLIEGSYARAGLVTDVIVYDDYPARYLTYTRRKQRWIRGDWQILGWLRATVPGPEGREPNHLSLLSRWKILDNLRRSLIEISLVVLLIAGWTILPGGPITWSAIVLGLIAAPSILWFVQSLLRPPFDKSWRAYYAAIGRDGLNTARQLAMTITFLAHQAVISADAIVRTIWRLTVSRRKLLEWQTASAAESSTADSSGSVWRAMRSSTILAVFVLMSVLAGVAGLAFALSDGMSGIDGDRFTEIYRLMAALPFVVLWLVAPAIAHHLRRPTGLPQKELSEEDRREALRYALLHWHYFDRFVTEDTYWLAPDNFQEDPSPVVAMRTSPTNIGLQLLATTSACDLGFITVEEMTSRLERVFRSLEGMRRFRGHFYNWYDLRDLSLLDPAYVSTVDSGNLAGHLIALRQACLTIPDTSVYDGRAKRAVAAALSIAEDHLKRNSLKKAAHLARDAHALLVPSTGEVDLLAALVAVEQALDETRRAGFMDNSEVSEWLVWSLSRIELIQTDGFRTETSGSATSLRSLADNSEHASELVARMEAIAFEATRYIQEMDFRFLFDDDRKLFSIGYNERGHALDGSSYDLLASEARLTSFVAVAKKDVPVEHWFSLGRTLTHASGETALVSWSGSMFEYLMPALVMRSFPGTLLRQAYGGAVRRQIAYGRVAGVPWGSSESAYNLRDRHLTYQYRAFGVPDLALKRGLARDLVIAPYASALAMMVEPHRGLQNLATLENIGALGRYGFYDALDYTRPDPGQRFAIVRNYMAHHMGMGMVALTNVLSEDVWPARFHLDPLVRAAELLLYERIPSRLVLTSPPDASSSEALPDPDLEQPFVRVVDTPHTSEPRVALLGRLPYTTMVTSGGGGYSRYENLAVTRWRADGTTDDSGQFCYVKDVASGRVWSCAHQPVGAPADEYEARLATDRVSFHRVDGDIQTDTEIAVLPEDSAEVRRVTVTNTSQVAREIEITSYAEIVLAEPAADAAHPAFSNLFVETEWHEWCSAITATRRPRSSNEASLWCAHVVDAGKEYDGPVTFETDRGRFIGRGRSVRAPMAVEKNGTLSGTTGAVLDPIFSLRVRLRLEPGQSRSVAFTTLVAQTRERAFELADRYHGSYASQRAIELAWASTQVELRELGVTPSDAANFQDLAGRLIYPSDLDSPSQDERSSQRGSQPLLWSIGISGDRPILLATIKSPVGFKTLRQLLTAHRYWRRRGLVVDLVIVNAHPPSYLQELHDSIVGMLHALHDSDQIDRPGGVFIRRLEDLTSDVLAMLHVSSPVRVVCDGRSIADIFSDPDPDAAPGPKHSPHTQRGGESLNGLPDVPLSPVQPHDDADVDDSSVLPFVNSAPNGFGDLRPDDSYELRVRGDHVPPAPWANVVANEHGGFIVSERGAGSTWADSSYFFRLTPWHNDPVADPPGEILYLRDDDTQHVWSATPAPVRRDIEYTVRHGAGFSTFSHEFAGIESELTMAMAPGAAVKMSILRLTNLEDRPRKLTLTGYAEWTLGVLREKTRPHISTFSQQERSALLAQNCFDPDFAGQIAFFATSEELSDFSADRRAFIGRNGTLSNPQGLRMPVPGEPSGGHDPCAALQCAVELSPGETREVVFILGAARGSEAAERLIDEYRDVSRARGAVARSRDDWARRLSVIRVSTPEPTFDAMLNHWSLYQALSCRMWGRSAVYQSGGAYGFRDQLQDVLAFVYAEPALAREHILRAAARQFIEGDVQHWWHPHSGRGVRTRFSDDLAWLPYVVNRYVKVTGDASILDESVPFLAMRTLEDHEHEVYDLPQVSGDKADVYEHSRRALERACTVGPHGLPLIGIGDWNDGMSRVGIDGKGESVWLAWFLIETLRAFAVHAADRGDDAEAGLMLSRADAYATAVETHGWDGAWYRRAYFDDGTPLGSADGDECRIDAIAQSWSVISGAGDPDRSETAMRSFDEHLVMDDARLIRLLTPPFDTAPNDPGYIKGYVPGVRENGAQYTHAALWGVMATAMQGRNDRAFELFQMINPLMRTQTPEEVATYRVEPYVIAADVYSAEGQLGRGGWTWYTGSASWMYRVGLESILGFTLRGDELYIDPHVPTSWPQFSIVYRHGSSTYTITVHSPGKVDEETAVVTLDGVVLEGGAIPLVDDGKDHEVVIRPRK